MTTGGTHGIRQRGSVTRCAANSADKLHEVLLSRGVSPLLYTIAECKEPHSIKEDNDLYRLHSFQQLVTRITYRRPPTVASTTFSLKNYSQQKTPEANGNER